MLRLGLMEISSGFLLLMALLFYFDQNGVIWLALLACFLHECGHWAIIHLCGGKVCRIRVRAVGAEMVLDPAHCLSYRREWLCTIAGPGGRGLGRCFVMGRSKFYIGVFSPAASSPAGRRTVLLSFRMHGHRRGTGQTADADRKPYSVCAFHHSGCILVFFYWRKSHSANRRRLDFQRFW